MGLSMAWIYEMACSDCWVLSLGGLVLLLICVLALLRFLDSLPIEAEGLAILPVKYESLGAAYGQGGKGSMVCI